MPIWNVLLVHGIDAGTCCKFPGGTTRKAAKNLYKQYIAKGLDLQMVIPNDLKYYPDSGRFLKIEDKSNLTRKLDYGTAIKDVKERSSFKKYLASYSIANNTNLQAFARLNLIDRFKPHLKAMLNQHKGIKFYFVMAVLMVK